MNAGLMMLALAEHDLVAADEDAGRRVVAGLERPCRAAAEIFRVAGELVADLGDEQFAVERRPAG